MLENLIFFFIWQEISENFKEKSENIFFEQKINPIEQKISWDYKKNFWKSWEIVDLKSWAVLWKKNSNEELPMASLTKLMSVLLILENKKNNQNYLNNWVKLDANSVFHPGSRIDIKIWEQFTVRDLLKWALIHSWNNAIVALAKYDSWTVDKFVEKMNKRAKELWLNHTHFENPTWFDDKWHFTTARDLAILAKYVYKYNFVQEVVKQKKWIIFSKSRRRVEFLTTNRLLSDEVIWMKTWTTPNAWQCLITIIKKEWKELLFVLLGSRNRFWETKSLINFVFDKIDK